MWMRKSLGGVVLLTVLVEDQFCHNEFAGAPLARLHDLSHRFADCLEIVEHGSQGHATIFPDKVLEVSMCVGGKVHREMTSDGKARLHRFIKQHAIRDDLTIVVDVLKSLRSYLGL
jgi:hypothetical protein